MYECHILVLLIETQKKKEQQSSPSASAIKSAAYVSEADGIPLAVSPTAAEIIYFPKTQFSPRFGDSFFTCSILSWSYNRDPTAMCSFEELFIRFEVELRLGRRTWTVHRRFSEFVSFHLYVAGTLKLSSSSSGGGSSRPPTHPPKSCYRVLYDRAFLNARQAALAVYVDELLRALSANHWMADPRVREFFAFDQH